MRIKVFFQKAAQFPDMVMHFVRKGNNKVFLPANVIGRFDVVFLQVAAAVFKNVKNHFGNGIAGDGIDTKIVVGPRILAVEFFYDLVYEREFAKLLYCEKSGAESVINVVVVVGNVVGKGCNLRFKR